MYSYIANGELTWARCGPCERPVSYLWTSYAYFTPNYVDLLGGALAGKYFCLYCSGQNSAAEKHVDTSRLWDIFENSHNCRQMIGMSRSRIFHAPESSQMPYLVESQKKYNLQIKCPSTSSAAKEIPYSFNFRIITK